LSFVKGLTPATPRPVNIDELAEGIWLVRDYLSSAERLYIARFYSAVARLPETPYVIRSVIGRHLGEYSGSMALCEDDDQSCELGRGHDAFLRVLSSPMDLFRPLLVMRESDDDPVPRRDPAYQIISYRRGHRFTPHFDSSWPGGEGPYPVTCLMMIQRDWLVGGNTSFPNLGLEVAMAAGDCLCWKNVDASSTASHRAREESLHAGGRVDRGSKLVLTLWIGENDLPRESWQAEVWVNVSNFRERLPVL
jgi:hypothetical protein